MPDLAELGKLNVCQGPILNVNSVSFDAAAYFECNQGKFTLALMHTNGVTMKMNIETHD